MTVNGFGAVSFRELWTVVSLLTMLALRVYVYCFTHDISSPRCFWRQHTGKFNQENYGRTAARGKKVLS